MTVEHVREQLEAVAEQLGEMAMAVLRDAVEEGATSRPEEEKRLTRARRSVEKAISILEM
ncbi:hypothetical protein [Candidatus Poriferisocius sp.]|uniref:hypothetical protein n=1 Tax=Candidatus Poriferisocius sp. TaxID=3101276 RepID=UPI003B013012